MRRCRIYELHARLLASRRRRPLPDLPRTRTTTLVPWVRELGFTHVELLPITEHPLDDSWGYQTTGYFAPTSRHGSADDLRYFIDECHLAGIGVLLDWVPGHFPRDAHGLANFDGSSALRIRRPAQAPSTRTGARWCSTTSATKCARSWSRARCYWLEEFHFDGLRVDAVASMLYLDFSRRQGDFVPNKYGGNTQPGSNRLHPRAECRRARALPRCAVVMRRGIHRLGDGEPRPTDVGGLGFSMKWNMGWMHDTLDYFKEDPMLPPAPPADKLTFSMMYAYSENFVLPLSHDEVVHLKKSLLGTSMPGDRMAADSRTCACCSPTMWTVSRQEAAVHGRRVRPGQRMELRQRTTLAAGHQAA